MRKSHARCVPELVRLRMLMHDVTGSPITAGVIHETTRATSAILAEAQASYTAALTPATGGRRGPGNASLLGTRLARLKTTAEDAVAAAWEGDAAALRQHLRRFDSLTTAIWTVLLSTFPTARARAHTGTRWAAGRA